MTANRTFARTAAIVVRTALVAGVLDISAALGIYVHFGPRSERLLQGIAVGVLGKAAYTGGIGTAMFGLACHFFIAFTWTVIYYAASRRMPVLLERPLVCGTLYALVVYGIMTYVVIPLSAIGPRPFSLGPAVLAAAILVPCIGIPIALGLRLQLR
jgi:hypothetical protein